MVDVLIASLNDRSEIVRANAAYALSGFFDPRVMQSLINTLSDRDSQVREAAAEALQQLSGMNFGTSQTAWESWWNQQKKLIR